MPVSSLVNGLVGGALATVVLTLVIAAPKDDLAPLSAEFLSEFVGGEPVDHRRNGLMMHLLYGAAGGAAISVAFLYADIPATPPAYLITTVVFGFLLSIWDALGRLALGRKPSARDVALLITAYLLYGVVLGAWLALDVI